ncbi:hypothetical protein ACWDSJ_36290 [Nocardia sp. NPDC003482]
MQWHLIVDFGFPGLPAQHYRADERAARTFASEATRHQLARVTVDNLVTPDMKPLPYQRLFLY